MSLSALVLSALVVDGTACLHALRAAYGPRTPPVVICTTASASEKIIEALEARADEYVMKPFNEAILLHKLAMIGLAPAEAALAP
jgi:two-component system chemotaxis response regulator CheY